jgi:hypothetical protein
VIHDDLQDQTTGFIYTKAIGMMVAGPVIVLP